MPEFILKAQLRKLKTKKCNGLREKNIIPAVVYGHDFKSISLQVPYTEFEKVFKETGESSLINLGIDGKIPLKVLIYDIQYHPLTNKIQHVDFYKIKAGEKITVETELKFINEAPVVKNLKGILVHNLDKIEIKCLPEDLVHEIEVDISGLATFEDVIRIKDLKISPKIEVLQDLNEVVVSVSRPQAEEEEKPAEEQTVTEEEKPAEEGTGKKDSTESEKR